MLQSILHLTGLDQKLQALRSQIEGEAQGFIQHGKAVAVQMSIVAALAAGAAVVALMAIVALLITLYLWLEPQIGSIAAMALVAGGLVVVGAGLAIAAVVISRKEPTDTTREAADKTSAQTAAARLVQRRG